MASLHETALYWLKEILGPQADFHPGQWEAIEALVQNHERVLVVQKTGWGKSLVYFLATRLLRNQGAGITILVSPLLSLMRNQIEAADRLGLQAVTINSTNRDAWEQIEKRLLADEIDLLLISPERLGNERFQETLWQTLRSRIGLIAVDEAHCISDWGHDFRPDYRRIMNLLGELPLTTPVLGTTATANDRVVADVAEILGTNIRILRGELTRASLELYVVAPPLSPADRLVLLVKLIKRMQGSGIIYCSTTQDCHQVAEWLQSQGLNVQAYYSGVEEDTGASRVDLEQQLLNNQVDALVASVALGMGFDKPDLHYVIHYQHPGSIIGYYQQIGRAGRNIDQARIILMHGFEDREIQEYFIETAFPQAAEIEKTIQALAEHGSLKLAALQRYVNLKKMTLDKVLLHLELEKVIEKDDREYRLTGHHSLPDYERWNRISQQRHRELAQMEAYIQHKGCLMRFIAEALDDPTYVQDCGRCQNCRDIAIKSNPAPDETERARRFLTKEQFLTFLPRKQWPAGGILHTNLKGRIDQPSATGLALCYYNDGGWGERVRAGKYTLEMFSPELVEAAAELLQHYWQNLAEPPTWVTCVPSRRQPELVPQFARQLAGLLKLTYYPVIRKVKDRPPQKAMQNSYKQVSNLWGAFEVSKNIPAEPVLLVDDMVDSGWTFAVLGELLRQNNSGEVYPFALAKVGR